MLFYTKPVMSAEEFRLFQEFVADLFGIVIDEGRENYLVQKLLPRLEALRHGSFAEYYAHLKYAPNREEEHQRLISLITNNETYLFREESQLDIFAKVTLPALKEKCLQTGSRKIRIISAGCSSGEEGYTLAMILLESGLFLWDWDIAISGVDIDSQVLAKAELGVYSGRAFQTTPPHYIDRYFTKSSDGMQVRESLRRITRFSRGNLLNLENPFENETVDIIFCRNVLIYFSEETIGRIVAGFGRLLKRDGLLFLGHSESLARITTQFIPERHPGAIIYKKRD
ncbi:MAG: protein-glutamate O-methyltransferase CheR [Geobacter sp.]|nr:protein-glutamate O-methyltransferase CheR [Geobacter sp.]